MTRKEYETIINNLQALNEQYKKDADKYKTALERFILNIGSIGYKTLDGTDRFITG